jgi:hypothetical protein
VLAIATYATRSYFWCWPQFLRRIAAAAGHHAEAHFILATDQSDEAKQAIEAARHELPEGWRIQAITLPLDDGGAEGKDYKVEAQMRIAALQGAAFAAARKIRATALWSVEADNLVPADALRVAEWALQMPQADGSNFYDVAAVTYPNGLFLGGNGTPQNPIAEDFNEKERKLPPRLVRALELCRERLKDCKDKAVGEREGKRLGRLHERVKRCPPDGNVFEVNGKHGWRRRGWMDFAYPGIGKGAIVLSDWCGLGCTLMSAKALALAEFSGYDGRGTQDLFLCWHRWHPAGLRIACIPHTAADHVKRKGKDAPADAPEYTHYRAYHETEGEYRGHLRVRQQAWMPC